MLIVAVLFVTMIGLSIWYLTRREPLVVKGEVLLRSPFPCADRWPRLHGARPREELGAAAATRDELLPCLHAILSSGVFVAPAVRGPSSRVTWHLCWGETQFHRRLCKVSGLRQQAKIATLLDQAVSPSCYSRKCGRQTVGISPYLAEVSGGMILVG